MNKHLLIPGILALCLSACGPVYVVHQDPPPPPPPAATPPPAPEDVTYQTFYDQLSPYGQWIDNPEYGYVWMPDAGPDFKPYASNGHWVATDEGWAWDSGYPWGWATFHYGRWFFQDGYGWMWIPGNEWAPAWVSWRNSDDYYGWAPLGPNVSFSVAFGGGYTPPAHYWCFVPHQYVASPQVNNYYVRETNNVTIINRTTVINNYTVNNVTVNNVTVNNNGRGNNRFRGGPDVNEVNRYGGAPIRPVAIRESRNPGDQRASSSDFVMYRPRVNAAPAGNAQNGAPARPAPTRYQSLDNARPVNRNSYGNGNQPGNSNNGWNRGNDGNNQPARTSPGYSTNPNNQPNNQPANNQPFTRPGAQPANNTPVNNTPVNNTPVNNAPVNNPPTFNRPTNNQPTYGRPTYNQPVNNQPANNQPVNNQPANNQPTNNQPANNGNPAFIRPGNPNFVRPGSQPNQAAQPVNNQPANNQPAGRPQQLQMQQNQGRPGNGFVRPSSQTDNRPATNQPKPAVQQHVPPPPPKKDPPKPDNKQ